MRIRTEAKLPEITLGESICTKLKQIYHLNQPWAQLKHSIPAKLVRLKQTMRTAYPDWDEAMRLRELARFTEQDIREALGG